MNDEPEAEVIRSMSPQERAAYDEQVYERIIRFASVRPNWELSPNCRLPGHERANLAYVGGGEYLGWEGDGASVPPQPVVPGERYSCVILLCAPGKGAPLHAHTTEEMFLVLSGRWAVYWGNDAEHEAILDKWDAISFPGPVMRGFRNVSDQEAHLLSVIGGHAPPPPINHPAVLRNLDKLGLKQSWAETHGS
jgi:mannose-6-phosphate isomerase-like protein (cupin superfamily)